MAINVYTIFIGARHDQANGKSSVVGLTTSIIPIVGEFSRCSLSVQWRHGITYNWEGGWGGRGGAMGTHLQLPGRAGMGMRKPIDKSN